MPKFCYTQSLYLALNAANPKVGDSTLPSLSQSDPIGTQFRILVPSVLVLVWLVVLYFGCMSKSSFGKKASLCVFASAIGFVVSSGGLFGRPSSFPTDPGISCGAQVATLSSGWIGGGLLCYSLMRCLPKWLKPVFFSIFVGGAISFSVFNQFPMLDSIVTGYAQLDNLQALFLGWGWIAWLSTAASTILLLAPFCFSTNGEALALMFLCIFSGAWVVTQSVRLLTRDKNSLVDSLQIRYVILLFAGSSLGIFVFIVVFRVVQARERSIQILASLEDSANAVRMIFR